jgi:uncharacterized membrane protein
MKTVLTTFIMAMTPVVELRGAIPYGVIGGLTIWESFAISVIGNMVPVPIIVIFVRKVFEWLRTKSEWLNSMVTKLENKADQKKEIVEKWEVLGLAILVAIPLPGTGAWTGALVAAMMDMRLKKALPAITLGVIVAGIIVSILTFGVDMLI